MTNRSVFIKDMNAFVKMIVESGYSYRKLANQVGVSQSTISLIVRGERNPSPETAINICKALNCQFGDIFFIQNDYKSYQKS